MIAAWMLSHSILEIFAPCLREEEQAQALAEVYARCKAGIEAFCIQEERQEAQRLDAFQELIGRRRGVSKSIAPN